MTYNRLEANCGASRKQTERTQFFQLFIAKRLKDNSKPL